MITKLKTEDRLKNALAYRKELLEKFGKENIEQFNKIQAFKILDKETSRAAMRKFINDLPEEKRDVLFEIFGLDVLIKKMERDTVHLKMIPTRASQLLRILLSEKKKRG